MTQAERNYLALYGLAAREFADLMLHIMCTTDRADRWLAKIMGPQP